jgi:hypothetical protein
LLRKEDLQRASGRASLGLCRFRRRQFFTFPALHPSPATIVYLFTTFPKATETFLQREIVAMQARGVKLRLFSLWGGGGSFRGIPVTPFPKWKLLTLFWKIPLESARRPDVLRQLLHGLFTRRAPSWVNFWENMLGAGFACYYLRYFRKYPPALVHAAWAGAPATAAWLLWRVDGHRFSSGAHAYDIYEHGGDWWLTEKLEHAAFVHTSTEMGRTSLIERGLPPEKIHCIHRGLATIPDAQTAAALARSAAARLRGPSHSEKGVAPPVAHLCGVAGGGRAVRGAHRRRRRNAGATRTPGRRAGRGGAREFSRPSVAPRRLEPARLGRCAAPYRRGGAERRSRRVCPT